MKYMKNLIIFIFVLLIFLFLLSFYFFNKIENFDELEIENFKSKDKYVEIIVSRFNEDLEWLNNYPFNKYPVILYNKGINNDYGHINNLIKLLLN